MIFVNMDKISLHPIETPISHEKPFYETTIDRNITEKRFQGLDSNEAYLSGQKEKPFFLKKKTYYQLIFFKPWGANTYSYVAKNFQDEI